jgi:hypothetical protein
VAGLECLACGGPGAVFERVRVTEPKPGRPELASDCRSSRRTVRTARRVYEGVPTKEARNSNAVKRVALAWLGCP